MVDDETEIISSPSAPVQMTRGNFMEAVDEIVEGMQDDEYEADGGKIKPNLKRLANEMKEQVKDNYSQILVVSSMKRNGMGKSTFLDKLGHDEDKKFGLERNFFFKGTLDDIKAKTNSLPTGSIICMDELASLWYKRRAMTKKVVDLNEWMMTSQRKTGVVFAGAVPDFWDLDSYARGGKIDHWVEVLGRGCACLFSADHFTGVDPWHPEALADIHKRRKKNKREDALDKIELLETHPCFKRVLFWSRMPEEEEKEYLRLVSSVVVEEAKEEDTVQKEFDQLLFDTKVKYQTSTVKAADAVCRLIEMLGRSGATIGHICKQANIEPKLISEMMKVRANNNYIPFINSHKKVEELFKTPLITPPKKEATPQEIIQEEPELNEV